jgi:hypothetical protein
MVVSEKVAAPKKLESCGCGSPGTPHVHPRYADNSIWEPLDIETGCILTTGAGATQVLIRKASTIKTILPSTAKRTGQVKRIG